MEMSNTISIWAPRFKDMKVLIAPHHIQSGVNRIVFTKTWNEKVFLMDGEKIKSYPMESNGSIGCHVVPVNDFEKEPTRQLEIKL